MKIDQVLDAGGDDLAHDLWCAIKAPLHEFGRHATAQRMDPTECIRQVCEDPAATQIGASPEPVPLGFPYQALSTPIELLRPFVTGGEPTRRSSSARFVVS